MPQEKLHLLAVIVCDEERYYKTNSYCNRTELASNLYYARNEKPAAALDIAVNTKTPLSREEYETLAQDLPALASNISLDFDYELFTLNEGETGTVCCVLMDAISAGYHIYHDARISAKDQDMEFDYALWNHRIGDPDRYRQDHPRKSWHN